MLETTEWKQDRARLLDRCQATIDAATAERRELTAEERNTWNRSFNEAQDLRHRIDVAELQNERERDQASAKLRDEHRAHKTTGAEFRTEDGKTVRACRHGESFAAALNLNTSKSPSLGRLIVGAATGDWRGAEEERTVYQQGTNASGGFLVPDEMSALIIDKARAQSVVSAAGAQTVPMTSETMRVALVETDPTAYWTAENQQITESEGTFGAVELRSRALAVYSVCSLELLRNASNVQAIIENTIGKSLALALDAACLSGTGAGEQPQGLLYSDRVTASAVGGVFTHDALINAMALCWAGNVEPNAWIMAPSLRKYVAKLKDGDGLWLQPAPEAATLRKFSSSQVTSADANGTCYVGDFSNCLIGIRSGIEIEASGVADSVFRKKQIAIRGLLFADFAVARSGDVVKMTGITGL